MNNHELKAKSFNGGAPDTLEEAIFDVNHFT